MMRATSDSDVSRFACSSPYSYSHSPPHYYVQSPSSDYNDEEKYPSRATPACRSPSDSPFHISHSRSSSSSRISGPVKFSSGAHDRRRRLNENGSIDNSTIEEEIHYYGNAEDDGDDAEGLTAAFKIFFGVVGFVLLCTVAGFVIWGLSRQYEPEVEVQSLSMSYLHAGIGQDRTGVPTKLISLNCTVNINVFNPAPYFGIHVTSTQANLLYSEITVALTQLEEYYLPRKSHQAKSIILKGEQVPLYGAGSDLDLSTPKLSVPMTLKLHLSTQGNVVRFLVKVKVRRHIACHLLIDSDDNMPINFPEGTCKFY